MQVVTINQHLSSLRERVVVLGAHGTAVCASTLHHQDISNLRLAHGALCDGLGLSVRGGHQVARLAAVAHHHVARLLRRRGGAAPGGHHHQRVLRPVQRRPQQLRHARVHLQESVSLFAGGDHVLDGGHDASRVGQEKSSRLNLQVQLAARVLGKRLERLHNRHAHDAEVGGLLRCHAAHLVASPQVERVHRVKLAAQVQRHARHLLPHRRVRARPDVRVHAHNLQVVLGHNLLDLGQQLEPDAKAGPRAAHVGLACTPRPESRVESYAHLAAWEGLAEALKLCEGARIDLGALVHQIREEGG
mmetsp:Transcript_39096/g.74902  ORF Transcript_39096/g.74902 Transcript_39096/m.74902 type:complete len:303 (-) Transcript_39096:620-1528(-)